MACKNCDCADCKPKRRTVPRKAPPAPVREHSRANGFAEPKGKLAAMRGYSDAPLPPAKP
jgi:hypothetical protein